MTWQADLLKLQNNLMNAIAPRGCSDIRLPLQSYSICSAVWNEAGVGHRLQVLREHRITIPGPLQLPHTAGRLKKIVIIC